MLYLVLSVARKLDGRYLKFNRVFKLNFLLNSCCDTDISFVCICLAKWIFLKVAF
jgi:hypothetical protein